MEVPIHRFRNKKYTRPVRIAVTCLYGIQRPAACLFRIHALIITFLTIIIIMRKSTNSHNHDNDVIVTSLITTDKM